MDICLVFSSFKLYQIFHYTRCITTKRVTSLRTQIASLRLNEISSFRRNDAALASRWQYCVDLIGPRFEPQTSRSRDKRVTARPFRAEGF